MIRTLLERIRFARHASVHRRSLRVITKWQIRQLRRLLNHAMRIPLWRDRLSAARIDPSSMRDLSVLAHIPVGNKLIYTDRPVEEYIDISKPSFAVWKNTSGTTGEPFTFLTSQESSLEPYRTYASFRFLIPLGYTLRDILSMRVARMKITTYWSRSTDKELYIAIDEFNRSPRDVAEKIRSFAPDILVAYPSTLLELASYISSDTSKGLRIPFVLSYGEMLSAHTRNFVERAFGCRVYNRYGTEELGVIGLECAYHDGFHVHSESVIVEITDPDGVQLPAGVRGRIVATNLLNLNMPFIRHDTGDEGFLDTSICHCGLQTPRLYVEGRYSTSLSFGGRLLHHLQFDGALDSFMNRISQYQIAKLDETSLIVRIVPGPAFDDHVESQLTESVQALVGDGVGVRVECVGTLLKTLGGKSRILIDESGSVHTV